MKEGVAIVIALGVGFLAGFVLARPASESSCCERVRQGFDDKVRENLGGTVADALEGLGVTDAAPALLDLFGIG